MHDVLHVLKVDRPEEEDMWDELLPLEKDWEEQDRVARALQPVSKSSEERVPESWEELVEQDEVTTALESVVTCD